MRQLSALAVPGLPEVTAGCDLAGQIVSACSAAGIDLRDDDVVVVASKVVAKAEGRSIPGTDRAAAIEAETVRVVAERGLPDGRVTRVVQSRTGPVLAAAGVDASDVEHGTVLLLPLDPDASARALRARIKDLTGAAPAVLVSDTAGRPWREGVTDFALGAAGLVVLDDVRGRSDRFGRPLEVTIRGIADEIASLADLVKGKASGLPVAVVRGLAEFVTEADGPGAAGCVRTGPTDWFGFGQVEAVRASLGVLPGDVDPQPIDPAAGGVPGRVSRALAVARAGAAPPAVDLAGVEIDVQADAVWLRGDDLVAVGVMAQRIVSALWSEGVMGRATREDTGVAVRMGSALNKDRA